MRFPDGELPDGVDASRECAAWFLDGRQPVAHSIRIRQRLFRRSSPRWAVPPLANLLSGARGSADTRTTMVLWLMFAQSFRPAPDGLSTSAANWARLLGLPLRTRRAGSLRRVGTARSALQQQSWIRPGRGGLIQLLDPTTGRAYTPETANETSVRMRHRREYIERKSATQARYHPEHWELDPLTMPAELWANGWVAGLSAKGLIAYMVLLNHRDTDGISRVPKVRTHQYAITSDLWAPAVEELTRCRLVRSHNLGSVGAVPSLGYELLDEGLQRNAPPRLFL